MNAIIYCALFPNGKRYIGQTIRFLKDRIYHHYYTANNKKSPRYYTKICNALRKYKREEVEWIIFEKGISSQKTINELERFYIEKYDTFKSGYNCTTGGDKAFFKDKKPLTEEHKRKISQGMKGKNIWNSGRKISIKTRKKLSERMTGSKHPMYGKKKEKCPSTKIFIIQSPDKEIYSFISIQEVKEFFKNYNLKNSLYGPNKVGYKTILWNKQAKGWILISKKIFNFGECEKK